MSETPPSSTPIDDAASGLAARLQRSVVAVISEGGAGSGTAWRDGQTIVTNHHVAQHDDVRVVGSDGREYDGHVIARHVDHDLAVIHVPAANFEPIEAGDALAVSAGSALFAVGNPWGQRGAVTAGVALVRPAKDEFLRADIQLAPGNSGGPLADGHGRVLGINSMISGGMALAVPAYLVHQVLADAPGPAIPWVEGDTVVV